MFATDKNYRPLYGGMESYFDQPIVYNGRNFILTLVKKGGEGQPFVVINNGFTIKDPFSIPVKSCCQDAWIFGLYYKLSAPSLSFPKKLRVKYYLKTHPEYFGCKGLEEAGKELRNLVKTQMTRNSVILVGFTKSATMLLKSGPYPFNVTIDGICPILEGTFSIMPDVMKQYLGIIYPLVGWIDSQHIVDEDIRVGSEYLRKEDYSDIEQNDVYLVASSLDKKVSHTWKDVLKLSNLCCLPLALIMDKIVSNHNLDDTGYRSNGFLSLKTQLPKFEINKERVTILYCSMPTTLSHKEVTLLIQKQIDEKNRLTR